MPSVYITIKRVCFFTKCFSEDQNIKNGSLQLLQCDIMDDVHGNKQLPQKPYEAVDPQLLKLLQCDVDHVVESLPESYLECLLSDPLNFAPQPGNIWHTVVLLVLLLLIAGQERCWEVYMVQHLCYQQTFCVSLWINI